MAAARAAMRLNTAQPNAAVIGEYGTAIYKSEREQIRTRGQITIAVIPVLALGKESVFFQKVHAKVHVFLLIDVLAQKSALRSQTRFGVS